jgi:molybdenum cofactor guanylyltransferase
MSTLRRRIARLKQNPLLKNIYGLILAGGESSRMGSDKSLLDFHGKPQREYLAGMLQHFCDITYTSCNANQNVPAQLNPLPDAFPFKGPLNAILTAFQFKSDVAWLSVPVDMPYINEKLITGLVQNRDPRKVATCYYDSDGKFPEPLFTLWEPSAFPLLMAYYETNKTTPRGFLVSHEVNILKSPDAKMHTNINSKKDLDEFKHQG